MSIFDPYNLQTKYLRKSHNGQVNRVKLPQPIGKVYTQQELEYVKQFFENQGYSIIQRGLLRTSENFHFVQTFGNYPIQNVNLPNDGLVGVTLTQIFTNAEAAFATFKSQIANRNIINGVLQFALTSFANQPYASYNGERFPGSYNIQSSLFVGGIPISTLNLTTTTSSSVLGSSDRMIQSYDSTHIISNDGTNTSPVVINVNLPTSFLYGYETTSLTDIQAFINSQYVSFQNEVVFSITRSNSGLVDPFTIPNIFLVFTIYISINVSI